MITGIDHVVIAVRDLDRAAAEWAALGFTIAPKGVHSAKMGTANHTIMLGRDYLELITVHAPTDRNAHRRAFLAAREGISDIVFATTSAAEQREAWRAAGIPARDSVSFARPVTLPDGRVTEAAFEVTDLPPDLLPGAASFVCQHLTRDAVWLPHLQRHANAAAAIREVVMVAPSPGDVASAWAAICGGAVSRTPSSATVSIGAHRIVVLDPAAARARYGALPATVGEGPAAIALTIQAPGSTRGRALVTGVAIDFAG